MRELLLESRSAWQMGKQLGRELEKCWEYEWVGKWGSSMALQFEWGARKWWDKWRV
jgi:hypothetical protein